MESQDRSGADDPKPVATDIVTAPAAPGKKGLRSSRPTRLGMLFGGVLAFMSLWEVMNPSEAKSIEHGIVALAVCVLWFVRCPNYLRFLVTAALFVWIVVTTPPPRVIAEHLHVMAPPSSRGDDHRI